MQPKKILVVDDSQTIAWVVKDTLEDAGYNVRCLHGGLDALTELEAELPDLVILDTFMPQMSGLEVLAKIKASSKTCMVPVIMLTASGRHEDVLASYKLGAEYYITKPFTQKELLHGMDLVLRREKQPSAA
ncbi:MAG TPA: response regulator [Verrucomicrobiae bacterium]|jgi:DNA-binding response OmpR family regulator|nr:response regulator [Verrucomicrobiae bacterium]